MEEGTKEKKRKKNSTSTSFFPLSLCPSLSPPPSLEKKLQGTYYGDNRGAGACSYQFSGVNGEPWVDGVAYRVALNSRQVRKEREENKRPETVSLSLSPSASLTR